MRQRFFLPTRRVEPDFVLRVLRDQHRQQVQVDPDADPDAELGFDSTVADWRYACDLLGWRRLGRALDGDWGIQLGDDEWKAVLEPAGERRLGGVCERIAAHADVPVIAPVRVCGHACEAAGAFLAIRSLLIRAGARAEAIRPGTPIEEYAARHPEVFLWKLSRLSPGALPTVRKDVPARRATSRAFGGCLLVALVALLAGFSPFGELLMSASIVGWLPALRLVDRVRPPRLEFGSVRSFRDLALTLTRSAGRA